MKKLIIANWKMNGSFDLLNEFIDNINDESLILALPYVFIGYAHYKNKNIKLSAQDCSVYNGFGARTGEISASLLKESGASYVVLGHSERRTSSTFDNTGSIYKKLLNALDSDLKVILCVDEKYETLLCEKTQNVLKNNLDKITIAYEPISAIGTGTTPSISDIENNIKDIKKQYFGIKTIYGGSVTSKNIADIFNIQCLDGVLIGGASLKIPEMKGIIALAK